MPGAIGHRNNFRPRFAEVLQSLRLRRSRLRDEESRRDRARKRGHGKGDRESERAPAPHEPARRQGNHFGRTPGVSGGSAPGGGRCPHGAEIRRPLVVNSLDIARIPERGLAGRIPSLPALILCYRGAPNLSTRISARTGATLVLLALMALAIPYPARAGTRDALPAGALKQSPSLYLRETASSPVRWQPWGNEAFELARRLKRPVLLDIGAAWCHWCHVMDDETYAQPDVAAFINRNFVPIKVDTDERPDIDSFYQSAASAFGAGGWPLVVFATPEGAPFFITSYMPPYARKGRPGYGMLYLLKQVAHDYASDPKLRAMAGRVAAALGAGASRVPPEKSSRTRLLGKIVSGLTVSYDPRHGGFAAADGPRFYNFPAVELALAYGFFGHPEYTRMATKTLDEIAAGGVYDQLGGGFHRYSTDPRWRVPHFEKMLYDQAMALRAYAIAYEATGDSRFAAVARSIAGYVDSTMLDRRTGAFYSSQDADAFPGDDGIYYTWTRVEIERAVGARDAKIADAWFGVADAPALAPNGRIVLRRPMTIEELAQKFHLNAAEAARRVATIRAKLLAARQHRRVPRIDRMVLTDRNALMADAYLVAGEALPERAMVRIGLGDIDFILHRIRAKDGTFYHVWDGANRSVPGVVADQVYMLRALLDAYQVSAKPLYLNDAKVLARRLFAHFPDPKNGLLMNRTPETTGTVLLDAKPGVEVFFDDPMPAVQATAARSFQALGAVTGDTTYDRQAEEMLEPALTMLTIIDASSHGALGLALENAVRGATVVAISGPSDDPRTSALWHTALATYRPGKVVMLIEAEDMGLARLPDQARAMLRASVEQKRPLAFVCAGTVCANPAATPETLARTIRTFGAAPHPNAAPSSPKTSP